MASLSSAVEPSEKRLIVNVCPLSACGFWQAVDRSGGLLEWDMSMFLVVVLIGVLVAVLWGMWNLYVQTRRFNEMLERCERSAAQLQGEADALLESASG